MTISINPWKLFRVVLALAALASMVVHMAPYDKSTPAHGCSMMHQE
jgi:hypothetical protein